jgi:hypothetical protein
MPKAHPIAYRRLKPGYEGLGLVLDFVARTEPFGLYRAGNLAAAIKYQLSSGCHIAAVQGETLVAYAGWLQITEAMGRAWVDGELPELRPVPPAQSNAAGLTIVRSESSPALRGLIRCCREIGGGQRIFFKRTGGAKTERRSSVFNAV